MTEEDADAAESRNRLPLVSVDGRPLPAPIRSGYGTTTIVGGYANPMSDPTWLNWVIRTSGGANATGTKANRPVNADGSVSLTFGFDAGPVFGPDDHTYRFGQPEKRR